VGVHPGFDGITPSPDDIAGSPGVVHSDFNNNYSPATSFGLGAQVTGRTSPSFLNAGWFPEAFWDGRARGQFLNPETGAVSLATGGALENQAVGPITNSVEMAHDFRNWPEVTQKLTTAKPMALATNLPPDMAAAIAGGQTYPALFQAAFGSSTITAERIAFAIATYERTLVPNQTPWDAFIAGNTAAMTPQQVRGWNIFTGPGRCNLCHTPGLFSDGQFRNIGLRPIAEDNGRQAVTGNVADRGKFKVPSLRNVGLRTRFMHMGAFTTLAQVVGFYAGGAGPNLDNKDPLIVPIGQQVPPPAGADLTEFLTNGLTDPRVRDAVFPFDRPTLASERIPPNGVQFGTGTAGTGARVPSNLSGTPGNIGNVDFRIGIANGRGGALAALVLNFGHAPLGTQFNGVNIHVDLQNNPANAVLQLGGTTGAAGAGYGTVKMPLPNMPVLAGLTLTSQWFVFDSGVASGLASSPGADIRFF
jgi:cytochrome c peroxidase